MTKTLSPAAQSVLDAYASKIADNPLNWLPRHAIAAALRAAADQVVRKEPYHWDLYTIAAELEGGASTGSLHQ